MSRLPHDPSRGERCLCTKCSRAWLDKFQKHCAFCDKDFDTKQEAQYHACRTYTQAWEVTYTITYTQRLYRDDKYMAGISQVIDWAEIKAHAYDHNTGLFKGDGEVIKVDLANIDPISFAPHGQPFKSDEN